jgi:hypothetical protein
VDELVLVATTGLGRTNGKGGWDGMGWDGMGWDGMGRDGMGWEVM